MLKLIKELFSLLTLSQRKRFFFLQILVLLMAFMEIIGVASIIPFMTLVGDMSQLDQNILIFKAYEFSGLSSKIQFVFLLGFGVLFMLFLSTIISMTTTWSLSMFASKVGSEISSRLYTYYLKQSWLFHSSGSSARLTKKIVSESGRVTAGIIMPLMQMNAKIVLTFFMGFSIFIYDPKIALIGLTVFIIAYYILFKLVRSRLQRNGITISEANEKRFRLMNEGFGGVKDLLLLGRDRDFINRFNLTGLSLAYSQGTNAALTQLPRYLMELVAFGTMIALILYLIISHEGNLGMILPVISVYALVGFKLLPAFQQIYASIARIKGNIAAFESIQQDLIDSKQPKDFFPIINENKHLNPKKQILLKNITFTYPKKIEPTLHNINMIIPANSTIGVVGPSGSGKSTLIDILLGLIEPDKGELLIDNTAISKHTLRSWQNTIGYVPQSIFLSESSITENVAFGIPQDQINIGQVKKSLKLAHLSEFTNSLDEGLNTKVGERGVQLSGGQRQRIGIARALYHEAEVLIFDEATSSLDGLTEKMIMEAIQEFGGKKTIIMIAHRLKTVQNCKQIFFIEKGQVVDQGTYDELLYKNEKFKKMSYHA